MDRPNVDTDQIIPKQFLKRIERTGYGEFLFYDWVREGEVTLEKAPILVTGRNFGCGSSREHAPQGLARFGITAIVGESFSEIFFGNSLMIGLPCVTTSPDELRELMDRVEERPEARLRVDLEARTCELDGFRCAIALPGHARDALITGTWDTTGMLLEKYDEVDRVAARLPYVTGF